jgi:aminobenzoyl-glutamate transport protein
MPVRTTAASSKNARCGAEERRSCPRRLAALAVVLLWAWFLFIPGTPLLNEDAQGPARLSPFFKSLVAGFFVLFLACGLGLRRGGGYGQGHRDIVRMMQESMADLAYYLVLAFAAAHFIAMFAWSNLGLIFAVQGAELIRASKLPVPSLLGLIVLLTGAVNLFVGSASAKWALLAPVLVPMMMLLGVSPEMPPPRPTASAMAPPTSSRR